MRIENVSIRNYRQYRTLDLDLRGDNLVILVGMNGTGKTNFLNALIWCLYGKEKFYNYDLTTTPIVNLGAIDAAADGELLCCEVTLDLRFTNGVEAKLTRRADFKKTGRALVPVGKPAFSVAVLKDIAQGVRNEAKPDHWIERWVPSRLEPYFLFDGERLDNFFKEAESGKIENAILQIAQIDLLARLLNHLEKVADDLYSAVGKAGTGEKMKLLNQQLEVATGQLAEGETELKKLRSSLEAFDEAVRVLEAQIGGIEKIHAEIEKRDRKTTELESISSQLSSAREKLYEWAIEGAARALLGDALQGLASAIDTARAERRLPPPVDPSLLAGLLEADTCVCGSSLAEGSSGRTKMQALLVEYERVGRIGEELLEVESQTRTHLAQLEAASSNADVIMSRIVDWEHRYATVESELAYLTATLAGHDDVKVRDA
ncbi:MAG: AAA family ATPase, partial [Actinomycetota bacterium]|nr:AAA family ATPase [Actinomycetota bacterium]